MKAISSSVLHCTGIQMTCGSGVIIMMTIVITIIIIIKPDNSSAPCSAVINDQQRGPAT